MTFFKVLITFLMSGLVFLFGLDKINLVTADLGRHLMNGRLFLEQHTLVSTNYYSYTMSGKPVVNHHWLSGVVFYYLQQQVGFEGLSFLYALTLAVAFGFFFLVGKRRADWWSLVLVTVLSVPLIGTRTEIRPEIFSLVFLGFEVWWLPQLIKQRQFTWWSVAIFTIIQVLWANLHLFFFLSWGVVGAMLVAQLWQKNKWAVKFLFVLLVAVIGASFMTPFGFRGVVEPLLIWHDFGYRLVENQTLFFMIKRFNILKYWHELGLVLLGLGTSSYLAWRYRYKHLFAVILLFLFSFFALMMNRLVPILGLMIVAFGSWAIDDWLRQNQVLMTTLVPFTTVFLLLVFMSTGSYLSPFRSDFGVGLLPNVERSAQFFKQQHLSGPIFNNYDVGGYLVYQLFPEQQVFVDNRPEAYSRSFFTDYIEAQEDEKMWQKLDQQYHFESIFFYRHDYTSWAQPFLIRKIQDKNWVPVYVDDYVLILVRNNEQNQLLIDRFELPSKMFSF